MMNSRELQRDLASQLRHGGESTWYQKYLKLHVVLEDGGDQLQQVDSLFNSELWTGRNMHPSPNSR